MNEGAILTIDQAASIVQQFCLNQEITMNAHCESVTAESIGASNLSFSSANRLRTKQNEKPAAAVSAKNRFPVRVVLGIKRYLHTRRMRRIDRDAFLHLAKLDDSLLKDIGVSRADVEWATKLPLSQNASDALQQISRGYKQRA